MRSEQLQRYIRYIKSYVKNFTVKKFINLIKVEFALKKGNSQVDTLYPYTLFCDLAVSCNLQCPLCQTGQGRNLKRTARMTLENYKKVVDPIKEYLFTANLYNWSEPFLNPEIYDIITYNSDNKIGTYISSNLNLTIDAERLVTAGLEHLVVSADGIRQEVYEKYRVNGKVDKVIENIKNIVAAKKKYKSKYPTIEWQCLINKYNENSIEETREFALSLGVNEVRFANLNLFSSTNPQKDAEEWLPYNSNFQFFKENSNSNKKRKPCFWLWRSVVVAGDGDILPCCLYDIKGWGNAIDNSIIDVWRNGDFITAREITEPESSDKKTICHSCNAPFIYK